MVVLASEILYFTPLGIFRCGIELVCKYFIINAVFVPNYIKKNSTKVYFTERGNDVCTSICCTYCTNMVVHTLILPCKLTYLVS